jgi:hypothetical protein
MKQKSTILVAVSLVGIAAFTMARPMMAPDAGDYIPVQKPGANESTLSLNANGAKKIRVDVKFGDVELLTSSTSEMTARVTKEIKGPIDTAEKKQWLSNPWLKAKRDGDLITIYEDESLKPKHFKGSINLNLKVRIKVPKGFVADLHLNAGSAKVSGEFESVAAVVDAGELEVRNCATQNSMNLTVNAGQIESELVKPTRNESTIEVKVGEIKFDSKVNADINASINLGSIEVGGEKDDEEETFSAKRQVQIGNGGSKVNLKVGTGAISIGSGKTIRKSSTKVPGRIKGLKEMDFQGEFPEDLNKTIEAALKAAEIESRSALVDAQRGMEDARRELDRMSPEIEREIQRAIADAQKEVAEAMKSAQLDSKAALAEAQNEMKRAHAEIERELKNRMPEMRREIKREMERARKEMKSAIEEAKKEMKRAREVESQRRRDSKSDSF